MKKNKVAPPYKMAEFDILFGSGISGNGCLLDAAEAVGVVSKRGSWYYCGEQRLAQVGAAAIIQRREKQPGFGSGAHAASSALAQAVEGGVEAHG